MGTEMLVSCAQFVPGNARHQISVLLPSRLRFREIFDEISNILSLKANRIRKKRFVVGIVSTEISTFYFSTLI